jgi:UDP-N-acetylglucosamine transferase subunit ALG13
MSYEEMQEAILRSTAVVCHGGPGTIMMCHHLGKTPIVVPRLKGFGEAVDDHQAVFARHMEQDGSILVATTADELSDALNRAVAEGPILRLPEVTDNLHSIRRFEELVGELLGRG